MSKLSGSFLILVFVSIFTYVSLYSESNFLIGLENRTWDLRVALTAKKTRADKRIKLIDINQASLDFFQKEYSLSWPFPRSIYNHVISFLTAAKAKGLAFDILFTESSAQTLDADREFAEAIGKSLPVVSAVVLNNTSESIVDHNKFSSFAKRQLEIQLPQSMLDHGKELSSMTLPIPEIIEHSKAFGNVQAEPDKDGVFRHYTALGVVRGVPVLALPYAFYNLTNGLVDSSSTGPLTVRLHGNAYDSYSLANIIQSQAAIAEGKKPLVDLSVFSDAWVIIGTTAPGLLDLHPTSLEERGSGLFYIAAVLDNIIHKNFIKTISKEIVFFITIALVILTLVATLFGPNVSLHLLRVLAIILVFLSLSFFLAYQGIWLAVMIPFIAVVLTALLGIALQYKLEGKSHRFIRGAFKYYVSPSIVEEIVANPSKLSLGGQKREATIMFSDIVGFTSFSERLEPQILVKMLNEYLSLITEIIQQSGGTVDKYVGDAVMAFWNAPLEYPDHASRAVNTAIRSQKELFARKSYFESNYGVFPDTRIGINTDQVIVGNFGSKDRFNYTVIGDGVNLASRLEGANKNFGTKILISENTKNLLPNNLLSRRVADLVVLGKSKAVRVFEPLYQLDYQNLDAIKNYEEGLLLIEKGELNVAKEIFSSLSNDPVAQSYISRIDHGNVNSNSLLLWNLSDK